MHGAEDMPHMIRCCGCVNNYLTIVEFRVHQHAKYAANKPARLKQAGIAHYSRTQRRVAYLLRCTMAIFREGSCPPRSSWQSLRRRHIAPRTACSAVPAAAQCTVGTCLHGTAATELNDATNPNGHLAMSTINQHTGGNLDFRHWAVGSQALPNTGRRQQPASFRGI